MTINDSLSNLRDDPMFDSTHRLALLRLNLVIAYFDLVRMRVGASDAMAGQRLQITALLPLISICSWPVFPNRGRPVSWPTRERAR